MLWDFRIDSRQTCLYKKSTPAVKLGCFLFIRFVLFYLPEALSSPASANSV